jgi:hypothetical protein
VIGYAPVGKFNDNSPHPLDGPAAAEHDAAQYPLAALDQFRSAITQIARSVSVVTLVLDGQPAVDRSTDDAGVTEPASRTAPRRVAVTDRSQIVARTRLVDESSSPTVFYSEPRSRREGPASGASRDSLSGGRRGGIGMDGQRRVPVHSAGGASSRFASRSTAAS